VGSRQPGYRGCRRWPCSRPTKLHDLTFTHRYDKAAPLLRRACAVGEHFRDATLVGTKQGKTAQDYLVVKMSDVCGDIGQRIRLVGRRSDGVSRSEFAKVDVEYKPQKADGSFDASVRFKYDIKRTRNSERRGHSSFSSRGISAAGGTRGGHRRPNSTAHGV